MTSSGSSHGTHDHVDDPRNADVLVYVDGELLPRERAVVSVFDAGFVLGDGVWEGLRVTDGHPAFLEHHLDRLYEGRWTNILDPGYRAYVRRELETGIRIARAEGAKVVLLTAPRFRRPERPGGGQWPENDPARVDRFNDLLRQLVTVDPTLTLIDLGARTSPGATYVDVVDGVAVRSDGVHYSRAGVEWIGPWLLPQLTPFLRP